MPLSLIIENVTSLPDGGPLAYTVNGTRGIDIGRDQYLDWPLPDPGRAISGKHCEVRWREGAYWLHDVSRNGTFVNQTAQRLQEPYRLRGGDRLYIGHYIIRVEIDGESGLSSAPAPVPVAHPTDHRTGDLWGGAGDAAPGEDPRKFMPKERNGPAQVDFAEWSVHIPAPETEGADFAPVPSVQTPASSLSGGWPPAGAPDSGRPRPMPGGSLWAEEAPGGPVTPPPTPDRPWGEPSLGISSGREPAHPAESRAPAPAQEPAFTPPPRSAPASGARPAPAGGADDFVARFAKGAGVSPEIFDWRDAGDLAEELGALTRLSVENLKQLLAARAEAKRVARASSQTMIQALDNNPLKFTPTTEDALRILFGRPTSGYLPARRAMEEGFRDLKTHQVKVYSAMQHALRLLLQDLDPEAVEASMGDDKGLGALLGSRKARLWDLYATRWDAMTAAHEDGMVDAFMVFFAECYDRGGKG
ncbi:type VI secretion system-associated FHA domain protein TagH [Methylobacterium segetis]|uniref:type VI secretion system-associated FHA domain protein TagH n=1 Tax=Methylobacterium segetis TaxID=2488750 RepID=UPI00105355C9|nr:type VI secretion system-associated FHA domain protein TagH [Methylobacterium segetis]